MTLAPTLLNDDGTASMATAIMMSHHGFRRDLAHFVTALERIARGDRSRTPAVAEEWTRFRATLHGHHQAEDNGVFPNLSKEHASPLGATIERLDADHRRIDPLLDRGDRAFGDLTDPSDALAIVHELQCLLTPHLATEEAELFPFLRGAKSFPPPATDAEAELYAGGFAWAMHGIAPDVLEQVYVMLPERLREKLPHARTEFEARCERVWGSAKAGTARTPIPDLAA